MADEHWGQYYRFTYSRFAPGTPVPTFTADLSPGDQAVLDQISERLTGQQGINQPDVATDQETWRTEIQIPPSGNATVLKLEGSGAICVLRIRVHDLLHRADEIAALRELTISIRWDGDAAPAVWSPLGDFFGTAMGLNRFRSLPCGIDDEGVCYSLWYMPFEHGARIDLANEGSHARRISVEVSHAPLPRPSGEYGRFHAKWHRNAFQPGRGDRWPDWTVLTTEGRGRFCGLMLHVWNPRAGTNRQFGREGHFWWGEGDEKFFVDGEKFPSTFGTGTEDYFGYAWCWPELFHRPFHGQTLTQNNKGHQALYRWHVADNVPFQSSFEACLEKYFPDHWPTRYAAVAYWYLAPSGRDPYQPVPLAQRIDYYDLTDAHEGENLKIVSLSGGVAGVQAIMRDRANGDSMFSGGSQLWWREGRPGDRLSLAVPVVTTGRYRVYLGMARAPDYGVVRIELDGRIPLPPVDLFERSLEAMEIDLGEFELQRGEVPLVLEITGANRHADPKQMVGIDYIKLVSLE